MFPTPINDREFALRQLGEDDRFVVSELRRRLLSLPTQPPELRLLYNWGPSDRKAVVHGLFDGHRLVSTLRMETLRETADIKEKLGFDPAEWSFPLPLYSTARAATEPEYRGQGLHSYLKLRYFRHLRELGVERCFASVNGLSPLARGRATALRRLHYEIFEINDYLVGVLDLWKNGEQVMAELEKNCSGLRIRQTH